VRGRWELDADGIPGPYLAAGLDDAHNACLADEVAVLVTVQNRRHQVRPEVVQLDAGVAQTGHLDHRFVAQVESRTGR
jgi:hypothetical protein